MATHLRDHSSPEQVSDICDAIAASLAADPTTASLAANWTSLTESADQLCSENRRLARAARRARARLTVTDSMWDSTVAAFGRTVVDASGGRRDHPPYNRFFAKTSPSAAQKWGAERELNIAQTWLTELERNPNEALAQTWLPKLKSATEALRGALEDRSNSVRAFETLHTSTTLFLDDINRELDKLEGELTKVFAGEVSRVGAFLAASRQQRSDGLEDPVLQTVTTQSTSSSPVAAGP